MTTFALVAIVLSVIVLLILVLSMCMSNYDASEAEYYKEYLSWLDSLYQEYMQEEADRLAALPQGIPTDSMLNDMAIEQEQADALALTCATCAYSVDTCKAQHLYTVCPHMLVLNKK